MESIKKLREFAEEHLIFGNSCTDFKMLIDEIEREIAERYMLSPVDADGVPIHVGEWLVGVLNRWRGDKFMVDSIEFDGVRWKVVDAETGDSIPACDVRHFKLDPVKELLKEFANNGTPTGDGGVLFEVGLIERYAELIRQAMK